MRKTPRQIYNRRKQVLRNVNKQLKVIAKTVGLEGLNLTTCVGRHTYAITLKNVDVSITKISEALGHGSERTTKTSLKQFDKDALDDIDERIL